MRRYLGEFLYRATPDQSGNLSGHCSVCGCPADNLLLCAEVLDKITSNLCRLLPARQSGTPAAICPHCLAIWQQPKIWHRSILATEDQVLFPLISGEFSSDDRPQWNRALRHLDPDQERVAVLTTDPKKRVWPRARFSVGDQLAVFVHAPDWGLHTILQISLARTLALLDFAEIGLALGISKTALRQSILPQLRLSDPQYRLKLAIERECARARGSAELAIALLIAQPAENLELLLDITGLVEMTRQAPLPPPPQPTLAQPTKQISQEAIQWTLFDL